MIKLVERLTIKDQIALFNSLKPVTKSAPFFDKFLPRSGARFNYRCTSAGKYGWYSDKDGGYRYETKHPHNHTPFPEIPKEVLEIVERCKVITGETTFVPETCLINIYNETSSLGIHQDNTESNLEPMIISISLGEDVFFHHCHSSAGRYGTKEKLLLKSGDVLIFSGDDRMCFHGVPEPPIKGTMPNNFPLKPGYRINLTIRQVN